MGCHISESSTPLPWHLESTQLAVAHMGRVPATEELIASHGILNKTSWPQRGSSQLVSEETEAELGEGKCLWFN